MLMYSSETCFEHSNFFKVNALGQILRVSVKRNGATQGGTMASGSSVKDPPTIVDFNYELFNCNNFNIRYWSWNYRGCWHQTCPPIVPR